MLFDWLIVRQVVEQSPVAALRGLKHVVDATRPRN
jgi:hypothetical protein